MVGIAQVSGCQPWQAPESSGWQLLAHRGLALEDCQHGIETLLELSLELGRALLSVALERDDELFVACDSLLALRKRPPDPYCSGGGGHRYSVLRECRSDGETSVPGGDPTALCTTG
eukprot:COSAG01_NODE_4212_length_5237_cov_38.912612_1_plen_117_part_00